MHPRFSYNMRKVMEDILILEKECSNYDGSTNTLEKALSFTGEIQRLLILQSLCDTQDNQSCGFL
jgi:hypothetical protein